MERKWILLAVIGASLLVAVVVVAVAASGNVSKSEQRAIEFVKEYLGESSSTYNS